MAQVFVDTSAFFPLIVQDQLEYPAARRVLDQLREEDAELVTSSYVLHESVTLLHRRCGISAVRDWQNIMQPILRIVWVDEEIHRHAMIALLASGSRRISLTDWVSFEVMRRERIGRAFTFDDDFRGRGFDTIP